MVANDSTTSGTNMPFTGSFSSRHACRGYTSKGGIVIQSRRNVSRVLTDSLQREGCGIEKEKNDVQEVEYGFDGCQRRRMTFEARECDVDSTSSHSNRKLSVN